MRRETWADKNGVRKQESLRLLATWQGSGDTNSPWGHHLAARTQLLEDEYGFTAWGKFPGTIAVLLDRMVQT